MSRFVILAPAFFLALASPLLEAQAPTESCSVVNSRATGNCGENGNPNAATSHLEVRGFMDVRKMAAGATVYAGGKLAVHGQITGPVTVQRGGTLEVNGQVAGPITCRGGAVVIRGQASAVDADSSCSVEIYGQVHSLQARGAKVFVNAGAIVNGQTSEKAIRY